VDETAGVGLDLNATADDVFNQRLQKSSQQNTKIKKMMENMGWQGKGLGKQEQGILNPLITKKAHGSATTGVIVESALSNPGFSLPTNPSGQHSG
jgi:hypothetical protein